VVKKSNHILIYLLLLTNLIFGQEQQPSLYKTLDSLYKLNDYKTITELGSNSISKYKKDNKSDIEFIIAKAYENLNKEAIAFQYYQNALKGYQKSNQLEKVIQTNYEIHTLLDSQNNLDSNKDDYLKNIKEYAIQTSSKKWLAVINNIIGIEHLNQKNGDSAKYYFNKTLELANKIDSVQLKAQVNSHLGSLYSRIYKKNDSALYFYNNSLKLYSQDSIYPIDLNTKFNLYNNIGNVYRRQKKYKKALEYYKFAEHLELPKYNRKSKKILYSNMDIAYYYLNDFTNAYDYLY
jgi:tetratricopeptide (TPR) repeat protein